MDRFLSKVGIDKSYLQLLAVACMFIASKLTEVLPLDARKLVTYTESSVTIQEIQVLISIHKLSDLVQFSCLFVGVGVCSADQTQVGRLFSNSS